MKFAPLELCKKLVELGCKSESGFHWCHYFKREGGLNFNSLCVHEELPIPIFEQNDFTGCHEQARENAKLVWGDMKVMDVDLNEEGDVVHSHIKFWQGKRQDMIESDDWVKLLEESLNEHKRTH